MSNSPTTVRSLAPHWPLTFGSGILAIGMGLLSLAFPFQAAIATGIAFGWVLSLAALFGIIASLRRTAGRRHWMDLASSGVSFVIGMLVLASPTVIIPSFAFATAVWFASSGVIELLAARNVRDGRTTLVILGLSDIALAVLVAVASPAADLFLLISIVGALLLLGGVIRIWTALRLRKISHGHARLLATSASEAL